MMIDHTKFLRDVLSIELFGLWNKRLIIKAIETRTMFITNIPSAIRINAVVVFVGDVTIVIV